MNGYITESDALSKLRGSLNTRNEPSQEAPRDEAAVASYTGEEMPDKEATSKKTSATGQLYERMMLHGRAYLCSIPVVQSLPADENEVAMSEAEEEQELARAATRGYELLRDMEGKPCLFFTTGWWSYSFCYNSQVKQFHSLPPGANGGPIWPPAEDPGTPSYVLGKFDKKGTGTTQGPDDRMESTGAGQLQKHAESRYLVQRLGGGTQCDLTGEPRHIEVQFHCHPQSADRIGWVKETATCSYLMVIYTPRLCNDIAFLPPKDSKANAIKCQEILKPEQVAVWEAKQGGSGRNLLEPGPHQRLIVGEVEVGAMKDVGGDGKRIERGRVVLTPEEKAETVIMQKDGEVFKLSNAELKKLQLDPDEVDAFRQELQQVAGGKDWRIERLDGADGRIQLRGVIAADPNAATEEEKSKKQDTSTEMEEAGSTEEYKESERLADAR